MHPVNGHFASPRVRHNKKYRIWYLASQREINFSFLNRVEFEIHTTSGGEYISVFVFGGDLFLLEANFKNLPPIHLQVGGELVFGGEFWRRIIFGGEFWRWIDFGGELALVRRSM
jgi:hypothetical protein